MSRLSLVCLALLACGFESAGCEEDPGEGKKWSLTDNLKYFETLDTSQLSHNIVKRGADPSSTHRHNKIREVGFRVLGRDFRLILSPKKGLLHHNFKAVEVVEDDDDVDDLQGTEGKTSKERIRHVGSPLNFAGFLTLS